MPQGRVPREGFRLLAGDALLVTYRPDRGMAKVFCQICGSSLFGGTWPDGPEVSVRFGAFDDDPQVRPSYRTFVDQAPAWEPIPADGLQRYPDRKPDEGT